MKNKLVVHQNFGLKNYNSFGVDSYCKSFCQIDDQNDLIQAFDLFENEDVFILGGGSNILLPKFFDKNVISIELDSFSFQNDGAEDVIIKVGAGVNWHELITNLVKLNFGGFETLALIPGKVGSAPVQNIGAYGTELKDHLESVEVFDRNSFEFKTLSNADCKFDYRSSIFKTSAKNRYVICSINIRLKRKNYRPNVNYQSLVEHLKTKELEHIQIRDVFESVIDVRQSKLPDPNKIGNAGSFFKNPIISKTQLEKLKLINNKIKFYDISETEVKLPAAWLIDSLGWKGKRIGNVGCYDKQALVIVNHGSATGEEINTFRKQIQTSVFDTYGINLQAEVNIFV